MLWAINLPLQVGAITPAAGVGPASDISPEETGRLELVQSCCTAMHMVASQSKETGYMPCRSHVPEPACGSQTLPLGAA